MRGTVKLKNRGITLITLAITIVVLLILSGVTIETLTGDNGILSKTNEAKIATELTGIKEELELLQIQNYETKEMEEEIRYMTTKEVNDKYPNMKSQYKGKIGLYREQPVYLGKEDEEISKIAEKYGYRVINMTEDEFSYYVEMGIVEDSIIENASKKIGRELSTADFPETIKIGDDEYSTGWYLIGNYTEEEKNSNTFGNQFEELGIKDITHAPYIVNYETGRIFSINGMIMYQAEIAVHTFQDNDFKLTNAITYVGDTSIKTEDYYGNLYSTSLYKGPWHGKDYYNDNNGNLQYDENGALVLDENNAIPVLEVEEKYQINDNYSVNVTVEGDINQGGEKEAYSSTIVALSDKQDHYICWLGFYKGYMHVYSYKKGPRKYVNYDTSQKGFTSIDISKYENKKMNIQIVAERDKETIVYVNGEKIRTFESGDDKYTYNYMTIGDLRVGRNLKFTGKIYNFAIYGVALTEKEIQENFEEAKKYGI